MTVPSHVVVGIWQQFEATIMNERHYSDPYRDVSLLVDYTRPDGSPISFWGFYDGGAVWKLRFMPDQIGMWRYRAHFSDDVKEFSGTFECVPSDVPGMLSADETNPIWFGYKGGKHVLIRSLHVGDRFFAANTSDEKRRAFLDWVQAQGYNTLSIASHYLNRAEPGRGLGWDTPHLWPLNAVEFQRAERILDELAERRIHIFPFAGFFGRGSNFPRALEDQELYIRYILARWGAYWNIMLNVGGPEPLLRTKPYLTKNDINRLGQLIRSLDVYEHPLTVHNPTGDDEFMAEEWPTFGTLQGPKTTDLNELSAGLLRNHHPQRPLYAQETLWSGNMHSHPDYSDTELRKNAYVIIMSAAALNFADNGGPNPAMRGDSSSGFSGSMDLSDRRQWRHDILKRVWDFFENIPFYRMRPAQHLVSSGFCLAEEGQQYLVYLPVGGAVSIQVRPAIYHIQWINAQDPTERRNGGETTDGQNLGAPSDGDDWLLYLTRC